MRIRFQIWGVGGGRLRQFRKGAPNRNLLLFFNARVASHLGSLICAPSASRGHAVERALHLLLNALNGPAADAELAGNLQNAFAGTACGRSAGGEPWGLPGYRNIVTLH